MNKHILTISALLAALSGAAMAQTNTGKTFTLSGQLTGASRDSAILGYFSSTAGKYTHVVIPVTDGRFTFNGMIDGPESSNIAFKNKGTAGFESKQSQNLYLEPGKMTIKVDADDLKHFQLSGSKTQLDAVAYDAAMKPLQDKYASLSATIKVTTDAAKQAELKKEREATSEGMTKATYDFMISHPDSYVTEDRLQFYSMLVSDDSAKRVYDAMPARLKNNRIGKIMGARFAAREAVGEGKMSKNFKTVDVDGKPISLADFKGKYIIVDFWASWCVPCRHSHPALRKIYAQYHAKGLEIIGVADDMPRPAIWRKAIEQDSIGIWHHVLDGSDPAKIQAAVKNPDDLMALYGVSALPTKFLIDPQGKIIMKETGSDMTAMANKIAELMK